MSRRKRVAVIIGTVLALALIANAGWLIYLQHRTYDVVAVLGQSNALGAGTGWSFADLFASPRVAQEPSYGKVPDVVLPAFDPLLSAGPTIRSPRVGPGVTFAEEYADRMARNVLLVPAAMSGTGFTPVQGYTWNPDDTDTATNMYDYAVSEIRQALDRNPDNELTVIIWHQGETDADAGMSTEQYADLLTSVIEGMRAEFGDVPVIIGGLTPKWVEGNPDGAAIDAAHREVAESLPRVAFVEGSPGMVNEGEPVHYDAQGQREMAGRYWSAFASLADG